MAKSPMVGDGVPQDWQEQVSAIALAAERKEVEIVRDAIAHYLGQISPTVVKGAITAFQERVTSLEQKLAGLGWLVRK